MSVRGGEEVSLARLYLMRAVALLGITGLFATVETLFVHAPLDRGVHKALIAGLWLMCLFALRYPLRMVPILLFEMLWKTIWLLAFGLPQWLAGTGSPRTEITSRPSAIEIISGSTTIVSTT